MDEFGGDVLAYAVRAERVLAIGTFVREDFVDGFSLCADFAEDLGRLSDFFLRVVVFVV